MRLRFAWRRATRLIVPGRSEPVAANRLVGMGPRPAPLGTVLDNLVVNRQMVTSQMPHPWRILSSKLFGPRRTPNRRPLAQKQVVNLVVRSPPKLALRASECQF